MNDHTFVIRTDKNLHEKIRKLAYLANTSRSAAIRKLLSSQEEKAPLLGLTSEKKDAGRASKSSFTTPSLP